jgi:hypothetical protein
MRRKLTLLLEAAAGLTTVVMLVQAFHRAYRAIGYDFTARLEQTRAFFHGVDPYGVATLFPLTYPLFNCVFLAPLAFMPYALANLLWFVLNGVCLWWAIRYLLRTFEPSLSRPDFWALFALGFLLSLNIVQNNFLNGQTNFLLLALCVLCFKYLREKRPIAAGLFLAAGVAVKVTPLILVAYLVSRRAWAALAWTFVGSLVFIFGLPWILAGGAVWDYYHGYLLNYLLPQIGHGADSLPLSQTYAFSAYVRAAVPSLHGPFVSLSAAALVLAPLVFLTIRTPVDSTRRQTLLFSAFLAAILWISPVSETHHLAYVLPAAYILTYHFLSRTELGLARRILPPAGIYLLLWLGQYTFAAYFAAIGICYVLLCSAALLEGSHPRGCHEANSR